MSCSSAKGRVASEGTDVSRCGVAATGDHGIDGGSVRWDGGMATRCGKFMVLGVGYLGRRLMEYGKG